MSLLVAAVAGVLVVDVGESVQQGAIVDGSAHAQAKRKHRRHRRHRKPRRHAAPPPATEM
jgi:hypothetical protein